MDASAGNPWTCEETRCGCDGSVSCWLEELDQPCPLQTQVGAEC